MLTKHIALLAAGMLMFSACQMESDGTDVATASVQGTLSEITHEPRGQAQLREEGGRLFATNMRTTADGVRSMYQPGVHWEASLDWASNVSAIRMNAINSRLSGEDTISTLTLDRVGKDVWTARAEFVSPNYLVNVYNRDTLVGTVRPESNQPVQMRIPWWFWWWLFHFLAAEFEIPDANGNPVLVQQCSWQLASPGGIDVTLGNTVLRGDRVEIIEDFHESYGGLDEIQVLGNGDVTYLSEQVVPE
jgi:hypothetical protein